MEDVFKRGFLTTSQQQERKQEASNLHHTSPSNQISSQQTQEKQPIKTGKRQKQTPITPTTTEKPRKKQEIVMHQAVREFDFGEEQVNIAQLALMVVNLQEEVQKLKALNEKLILKLEQKEEQNESRLMTQEREMNAFWNIQQDQSKQIAQLDE